MPGSSARTIAKGVRTSYGSSIHPFVSSRMETLSYVRYRGKVLECIIISFFGTPLGASSGPWKHTAGTLSPGKAASVRVPSNEFVFR